MAKFKKGRKHSEETIRKIVETRRKNNSYKFSEDALRRMSEAQKRRFSNPEERKKLSEAHKGQIPAMKGRKHTTKSLLKMSESHKKQMANPEMRVRLRKATKKLWKDTGFRNKQIQSRKGKHYSQKTEFKRGLVPWMKGKTHSQETKEKIKIALKKRFPDGRQLNSGNFKKGLTPWNIGRTYTEEERKAISKNTKKAMANPKTRDKLRINTLKMYESGAFPKQIDTKIEKAIKEELIKRGYKEGIDFIHQFKFMNKFMCDFCFPKQKIIIEAYGDFWHANPKKYSGKILHPHQIKGINRDKSKEAYITKVDNSTWTYIFLWESDINKNVSKCVDEIEEVLNKKKLIKQ